MEKSIDQRLVAEAMVLSPARCGRLVAASATLWQREMVRFFRQRNRVVGALATPIVFWLLLGSGLDKTFQPTGRADDGLGVGYLEFFFPGTVVLILLFTAIFSTISVIEERREGFLQAVLVSPIPRMAIVLGKVLGGASIATIQGILFLLIWPLLGSFPGVLWMIAAVLAMFVLGMGLTGLGLCIAWPMDSTAGYHAVMNLFLMPMWFLSGAVFPLATAPGWMRTIMWINPLTYEYSLFAQLLGGGQSAVPAPVNMLTAAMLTLLFTTLMLVLAAWLVGQPRKDGT